jgi:hypothetical protein
MRQNSAFRISERCVFPAIDSTAQSTILTKNQRWVAVLLQIQFEEIPMRNTIAAAAAVLLASTAAGVAADMML